MLLQSINIHYCQTASLRKCWHSLIPSNTLLATFTLEKPSVEHRVRPRIPIFILCFSPFSTEKSVFSMWLLKGEFVSEKQKHTFALVINTCLLLGLQVVTCAQTTGTASVRCTAPCTLCAGSSAPAARRLLSPRRTSPTGSETCPERWGFLTATWHLCFSLFPPFINCMRDVLLSALNNDWSLEKCVHRFTLNLGQCYFTRSQLCLCWSCDFNPDPTVVPPAFSKLLKVLVHFAFLYFRTW